VALLAAAYFGAAQVGLSRAFVAERVTAVWPPTGIALAAGALYPLARADLAPLDPEALPEPWPLTAPGPDADEEIRWAGRRSEAKWQVTAARLDGRRSLRQAATPFRDLDADWPDTARRGRPPWETEEEWPYRQVLAFVQAEWAIERRAPAPAPAWVARLEAERWG
jgi:hypothetical protein